MQILQKLITNPANYTQGRHFSDGNAINTIVLHTYGGKGVSLQSWFQKNTTHVSSHYAVRKDGVIEQYVRDQDTAHANGHDWYNAHALSIEFQDDGRPQDATRTDALYEAGSQLIFTLCLKYSIPINDQRVTTHSKVLAEINKSKYCPGALDIPRLINGAKKLMDELEFLRNENFVLNTQQVADKKALADANELIDTLKASTPDTTELEEAKAEIEKLQKEKSEIGEVATQAVAKRDEVLNSLFGKLYLIFNTPKDESIN